MAYERDLANYYQHTLREKSEHDIVFFFNNCLKTFDPRTKTKDLPFTLYPFQETFVKDLKRRIEKGQDLFVEKSRDMGVSWMVCGVMIWFWIFHPGFQALLGSRKEDLVDNRSLDSLFGKLDYFMRYLPFPIDKFDPKRHRLFMKLVNPTNNATIQGESANDNFGRGGRYSITFFDELAFWPFARNSWEGAGDSSPCRIAVTTPSPGDSFAKKLRSDGEEKNIIDIKSLHWKLHPLKDEVWYKEQGKRRTDEEIARELDINWEGSVTGRVYHEIDKAILGYFPFIAGETIYTGWDFGLDGTAVQWWQRNPENARWRLLNSYTNQDKTIEYYFPFFGDPISSVHQYTEQDLNLIARVKTLPRPTHFGDPDVSKRSLLLGTTTRDSLNKAGIYVQTNTKSNDFESRKQELKRILQDGIEVDDNSQNKHWLECMKNARYPDRQDTAQSVTAALKPIHNWTSHHRSASEYFAVNVAELSTEEIVPIGTFEGFAGLKIDRYF